MLGFEVASPGSNPLCYKIINTGTVCFYLSKSDRQVKLSTYKASLTAAVASMQLVRSH